MFVFLFLVLILADFLWVEACRNKLLSKPDYDTSPAVSAIAAVARACVADVDRDQVAEITSVRALMPADPEVTRSVR